MAFGLSQLETKFGWSLVGVAEASISPLERARLLEWLSEKDKDLLPYIDRRLEERLSPQKYLKDCKSILCFGLFYFPGWAQGDLKISNYSWGKDYHEVLKQKLIETEVFLKNQLGNFQSRICVDTAPVLEKLWAIKAGLGWQGKNTLVLNPHLGSTFFLGEILTDLPVEAFEPRPAINDHCGKCQACITACPTDALKPYQLQVDRCISFWTLDHKQDFDERTPDWKQWVAGCDICQEVCPWNSKLIPLESEQWPNLNHEFKNLSHQDIQLEAEWNAKIQNMAISYVKPKQWVRNLQKVKT